MANGGSWEASTPLPQAPADKRPGHVGSWRDPRGGELLDQAGRRAGGRLFYFCIFQKKIYRNIFLDLGFTVLYPYRPAGVRQ